MPMKPLIIGLAGGSGSGKSTVARNLASALGDASVAFLDMDAYYLDHSHLPFEQRKTVNWDHPNAFDWDLLVRQLTDLSEGRAIEKPVVFTIAAPPVDQPTRCGGALTSSARRRAAVSSAQSASPRVASSGAGSESPKPRMSGAITR